MRPGWVLALGACSFAPHGASSDAPPDDANADGSIADVSPDAQPPAFALSGMQWLIACKQPLNNGTPAGCTSDATSPDYTKTMTLAGAPGEHWTVTLRVAGAMERIAYGHGLA